MEELEQSYRIVVRRASKWRNGFYLFIWLCYSIALITWPFDLSIWLKCGLSIALGLTGWRIAHLQAKHTPELLFLTDEGDIGFDAQSSKQAQLSAASFVSLYCVKLYIKGQLERRGHWMTLYGDQLTNADMSRLKRIVYRVRRQQG